MCEDVQGSCGMQWAKPDIKLQDSQNKVYCGSRQVVCNDALDEHVHLMAGNRSSGSLAA